MSVANVPEILNTVHMACDPTPLAWSSTCTFVHARVCVCVYVPVHSVLSSCTLIRSTLTANKCSAPKNNELKMTGDESSRLLHNIPSPAYAYAIMPVFICISAVQWFYSSWLYRCFFVGGVDNFTTACAQRKALPRR